MKEKGSVLERNIECKRERVRVRENERVYKRERVIVQNIVSVLGRMSDCPKNSECKGKRVSVREKECV